MCKNNCGCNDSSVYNPCGCSQTTTVSNCSCPPSNCSCPVYISSDCVNDVKSKFDCSGIATGLTLTETLEKQDKFICDKFNQALTYFRLKNVGGAAEIYKGQNGIGEKELRTIDSKSNLLEVEQATDKIRLGVNETNLTTFINNNITPVNYNMENVGTGAGIYKSKVGNLFSLRSLKSSDSTVNISVSGNEIDLKAVNTGTTYTGSNGVTLTGTNFTHSDTSSVTDLTPATRTYVKSLTFDTFGHVTGHTTGTETDQIIDGSETKVQAGTNVTITGTGTTTSPYVISSTSGSGGTKLASSATTTVTGLGTTIEPYQVNVKNLQSETLGFNILLNASNDGYTIFIQNTTTPIVITVPLGLPSNFTCGFIQEGPGDIEFQGEGGVTIHNPIGFKIKGQKYQAFLEKKLNTETYYLLGNTKS